MTMLPIVRQSNTADLVVSVFKISTAHLPRRALTGLKIGAWRRVLNSWESCQGGAQCQVPDTLEAWRLCAERLPRELYNVLRRAYDEGCEYVWFHPDADQADDLPTWEW